MGEGREGLKGKWGRARRGLKGNGGEQGGTYREKEEGHGRAHKKKVE